MSTQVKALGERDRKLESLGYPLERVTKPGALYQSVVVDGTTVYTAGAVPFDGAALVSVGKVPSQVSMEDAKKASALCAANILRTVIRDIGSLERIERVLRMTGYVNSDSHFTDQHLVINGASELLVEIFGELGRHARTALGMYQLPLGSSVEVEIIFKLKS